MDTTYSKAAFSGGSGAHAYIDFASTQTEIWFHVHLATIATISALTVVSFYDGSDARLALEQYTTGGNVFRLGYWNGASLTYLTTAAIAPSTQYDVDVHFKRHASSGVVAFYVGGTLVGSFTGDTTSVCTSLSNIAVRGSATNAAPFTSQVMVNDGARNTVGLKLMTFRPASTGNASQWTNGSTVTNVTDWNDTTNINTDTAGNIQQYNCNALASGGFDVLAVSVGARAQNAVGGPQNLQLGVRSNSADTWTADVSGITTSYAPFQSIWETNPNNGNAAWTASDLTTGSFQVGVKATT